MRRDILSDNSLRVRKTSDNFAWRYLAPQWPRKSDLVNVYPTLGSFADAKGTLAPARSRLLPLLQVSLYLSLFWFWEKRFSTRLPRELGEQSILRTGTVCRSNAIIRLLSASWINLRRKYVHFATNNGLRICTVLLHRIVFFFPTAN